MTPFHNRVHFSGKIVFAIQEYPTLKIKKIMFLGLLTILGALVLSACAGGRASIVNTWPGLAADSEKVYLASGSHLYAVDAKTGKEVWRYPVETDNNIIFYANPVVTPDGQLLIGSEGNNHELVSIDPETGKDNWTEPFSAAKGKWVGSPLVFNDTIYAPNSDGFLYILDLQGKQAQEPIELGGALWAAPATDGTYLYITSLDHHLHIIDPTSAGAGKTVDLGGATPGSPVVGEGGVYVGSFSSAVEFIQPNGDHQEIAKAQEWIWGTPALSNGILYYADLGGNLYATEVATGSQNWDGVKPDGPVVASPLVVGDLIYFVTEEGTLLALDKDAKVALEKTVGGKLYTTPVVSGDLVVVAPYQAEFAVAAYDAEGKQVWTYTPEK